MANKHVVIVGGGLAGWRTAEELRAAGFTGRLTVLSNEEHPPYDRPPLSKRLLKAEVEATPIALAREGSDESTLQLDLRRRVYATGLQPGVVLTEEVTENGVINGKVNYDALVIATGVRARELPALAGHSRVFLLRTFDDVLALRRAMDTARSLLVVGAGFIGAEVATAAHDRGITVTVIEALDVPYERTLGSVLGGIVGRMAGRYGVQLRTGTGVEELLDSANSVRVRLTDGSELEADIAVVGVGTQLNVEWLAATGADWKTGVTCDGAGRVTGLDSSYGAVYALGDVAAWHDARLEEHLRFEHWTTAVDQAPVLARALVGDLEGAPAGPAEHLVPYFWSDQYGRKVQLLGRPSMADSVEVLHGEDPADPEAPAPRKLIAGYFAAERLVAIAAISAPALLGKYRPLLDAAASREQVRAHAAELGATAAPA